MSQNIEQIFVANPATAMQPNDLFYLGRSPYGITNDMAILWSNVLQSLQGLTTTVSSVTPVVLTVASTYWQLITGSTAQTFTMPVVSTLTGGQSYFFINNSSAIVTLQSSGANTIALVQPGQTCLITCILTTGTTAASWDFQTMQLFGTNNNLYDSNNNVMMQLSPIASAVNFFLFTNNITGTGPQLRVAGADTNIGLVLQAKGTQSVFAQSLGNVGIAFNTGTAYQHGASFTFANTASSQTITYPDGNGTVTYNTPGTFVPVLVSSGGGTATYSNQIGTYTQIGNRVIFDVYIQLATSSLGAGTLTISGLPVAAGAQLFACQVWAASMAATATTSLQALITSGASVVTLYKFTAGAASQLSVSDIGGTSQIAISGQYHV